MGKKDVAFKDFVGQGEVLSEIINNGVHGGRVVVDPATFTEKNVDASQLYSSHKSGTNVVLQRERDLLSMWEIEADTGSAVYAVYGIELQGLVDFIMPVRVALLDMMNYLAQAEALHAAREIERANKAAAGEPLEAKSSEELINLLREGDLLKPCVTAVLYLGPGPWKGPRSIHELLEFGGHEELKEVTPDYKIHVIAPGEMPDEEIAKYKTEMREVLMVIKHSGPEDGEALKQLLQNPNYRFSKLSRRAANAIAAVSKRRIHLPKEQEDINMQTVWDVWDKEHEEAGALRKAQAMARAMQKEGCAFATIVKCSGYDEPTVRSWLDQK